MAPAVPLDPLLQDTGSEQAHIEPSQQTSEVTESQRGDELGTKRSSSYTEAEDVQLCRSWIVISEDPLIAPHSPQNEFQA
ncbi:uncharacterized protein PGTG_21830 [Puccinia graminis f. sp. tritici CRL 75-36-700-3]|uniref:Uncharacterized protein n=1 Tax=Puccinia graminis f. sp. tritici (strain CRL 75-36-700-3 / race SCCL) TaxID=418459 RepID=H6QSL6_PUCGT|nr:uncharacterized protein PGTG_21830 [Puccinia graminis f. sp. tritici CRL 75-36-700-3]EHS63738.1 hypothetical protein PGTG_21830 [Puccinia graminis f. sp. tritici CRL 75-36-700-3]